MISAIIYIFLKTEEDIELIGVTDVTDGASLVDILRK